MISTIVALDREDIPSFTINIRAKDLGSPSRNSTTFLTVTVSDANDNFPEFDSASLSANVTEERPKGEFVTRLVAKDLDIGPNAEIEYKLDSNAKQFLKIDSQTGTVTTLVPFDFEVQRNHSFKVIASDKGIEKGIIFLCFCVGFLIFFILFMLCSFLESAVITMIPYYYGENVRIPTDNLKC